ncbi:FAD-binding oxidoreductase [Paucibacter sp. R3-3]|uniref:FAD-binding oxidoreductase n=1 Tax=Roseateles agri TaxID=3098619 RepID=A0ABU5DCD9_9BURK|nr:FAD-binding oxidoreductase [Paucibacter sp. R3-3]MDY0743933.1 FAD-binding oxidoreductase [Paucibacter sp. R3-3]
MSSETKTTRNVDCIVIGAGMAGASAAAALSAEASVVILEAEAQAGYHSTGRSAALYSALYGNAPVRALTRASLGFFREPREQPYLCKRDTLFLIGAGQQSAAEAFAADADIREQTVALSADEVMARVPILQRERVAGALLDLGSADIEVDLVHQGFLRQARANGAELHLGAPLLELARDGGVWIAQTAQGSFRAPVVVNAAGAWADPVAALAGIAPLGLQPLRRTAVLIDVPEGLDASAWPAVIAVDESQYFKPDAGLLLISAADETPSPPCDAQPDELDVAIAVDRFETLTGRPVRRLRHQWAGLRVFSPDRTPVLGFEPEVPGFFWCAGQGGYGIQTSPAMGRAAAALALGAPLPDDLLALGVQARQLSPARFRNT